MLRALRRVSRRSFLASVIGGATVAGTLFVGEGRAAAQGGCSDHDASDPAGSGQSCTGCTDADSADSPGSGRHCTSPSARSGCSDRDPGDAPNNGTRCRPCSDRDKGASADPFGRGRHCGRR